MDLSKVRLPAIYKRNKRECYLDPIRQKLIYITPEETVRQKIISYLLAELNVPNNMLRIEEPLSHYGLKTKDRADIVICSMTEADTIIPLAVIECKAETVDLTDDAFDQAQRYSDALLTTYTMVTNGNGFFCYKYDEENQKYIHIKSLPSYADMLKGECVAEEPKEKPPRIPFNRLEQELLLDMEDAKKNPYYAIISYGTPMSLALPIFNLWEGLYDTRIKMPEGNYGMFRLIEDYGIRMLSYGNGSGGQFFGPYRSFLVEVDGNTEFYSISITTYWKSEWDLEEKPPKTCICIAHDDEKTAHHALQLVVEDNAVAFDNIVKFYHNGRIAVGRIGSGKKSELMEIVSKRYPKIIQGGRYYLGSIKNDHLLRLDEPDVIDLVVNLISYSIVRDEFRDIVKDRAKKQV